jgi:hypothetical protein
MNQGERTHAELIMLYARAGQDILKFEDRQPQIASRAVLVYAALIGYARLVPAHHWLTVFVLSAAATFTAVASWLWLKRLQGAIYNARTIAARIREQFSEEFRQASGIVESQDSASVEDGDTIRLLGGFLAIGLGLTWIALWALLAPRT